MSNARLPRLWQRMAFACLLIVAAGWWLPGGGASGNTPGSSMAPAPLAAPAQAEEEEEHGGDVVFHVVGSKSQKFSVLYSHQAHLDAGLDCKDCHDKIFKKEFEGNHFKMADINKGKACGICHNSSPEDGIKAAFPPRKNCDRCHTLRVRTPER